MDTKCKICRRAGQKLFLKEGRCLGYKCTLVRKPYPPGRRRKKKQPSKSEYGLQLRTKQSLKFLYCLKERQFVNYVQAAMKKGGTDMTARLVQFLESRLDNVVFRMGLAQSRTAARQLVSHGHIYVNGRKVTIPSRHLKKGDQIAIRPQSISKGLFVDLDTSLKKYTPPSWLKISKTLREGQIVKKPDVENIDLDINLNSIIEFYSR